NSTVFISIKLKEIKSNKSKFSQNLYLESWNHKYIKYTCNHISKYIINSKHCLD
ncbi:unnamed protein product, partial [Arabidopsis halleri]